MKVYKDNLDEIKVPVKYYLFSSLLEASKFCDKKEIEVNLNPYKSAWIIAEDGELYYTMGTDLFLIFLIDGIVEEVEE